MPESPDQPAAGLSTPAADPDYWNNFDANPWHQYLGLRLLERRLNYGRIELHKTATTPGGIGGSVHGGVLATMIDVVTIVAIFAELREDEQPAGTADLNISYLRQAHGERIICEGQVIKRGRQLAVIDASITDMQGRLCCRGRVLYAFRA
jgi:uncharacterized protein (TIGR00369 family)